MQKKYSIALWGWAARWLVHIWVLRYFEQNNLELKQISWTSMWAIVWALFADWNTTQQIEKFAKELSVIKLIDFWASFWVMKWVKVLKKLEELFWDKLIEDLKIPLKIIATDIETWDKKIFESWKIIYALRASISLPWVFIPYEIWEKSYIDWWITNNLPVDVLSWENIVWVSALKQNFWRLDKKRKFLWFYKNKSFFRYNYEVLHRTVLLMMKQNEEKSIKNCDNSIIIKPNFWKLDYYSFDKVDEFIKLWLESAQKNLG